jgi:hypothetical protein
MINDIFQVLAIPTPWGKEFQYGDTFVAGLLVSDQFVKLLLVDKVRVAFLVPLLLGCGGYED